MQMDASLQHVYSVGCQCRKAYIDMPLQQNMRNIYVKEITLTCQKREYKKKRNE